MVLASEMPAHCLMIGEVGSSKTLFLQELSRLPSSRYVLGSSLSRAGLYELMFVERPKYLLVDEIDKVTDYSNVSALLSLMETGILAEVKYNKRRQGQFNCWVMAGCNNEDRIPPEILSRFGAFRLRFGVYTPEEFIEVVTKVLVMRERTDIELAKYIASVTLRRLNSRDVRVARSIARTAHTKQAVDDTVALLEKQGR